MSLKDLRAEIQALKHNLTQETIQHIKWDGYNFIIPNSDPQEEKIYVTNNTASDFHRSDSFVRCIMGPYGSGKSTAAIAEIVRRACEMPYWSSGRRRSKWAIIRNTSGELQTTTLQTWLAWFGRLGDIQKRNKPVMTYEHSFNDGKGIVELELIFLALDREDDLGKVRSLEVTGCYLNELSEVPQGALVHFKGRVGRYPSKDKGPYWSGIIADTNPPDVDHWIYKQFELEKVDEQIMFHQPPGLLKDENGIRIRNLNADNVTHLDDKYYLRMALGQTQDFIKVFCLGQYGAVNFGKKVYPEYNDDLHAVAEIEVLENEPIYLGWDFGFTPACVVIQFSHRGQMRVLKEYTSKDMGIKSFAESIVLPSLRKDFPSNKIGLSVADPSGIAGDKIMGELSDIGILNNLGIKTEKGQTNDIDTRISSVRYFLNTMIDGQPGCIIDKFKAPMIRKGCVGEYCYKRIAVSGEERYRDVPDKNEASHPHDAWQYIALPFAAEQIIKSKRSKSTINMYNPGFRYL